MEEASRVLERIQKLLNMSEDVSSPNEAAVAATKMREMLMKHNLSLSDIKGKIFNIDSKIAGKVIKENKIKLKSNGVSGDELIFDIE